MHKGDALSPPQIEVSKGKLATALARHGEQILIACAIRRRDGTKRKHFGFYYYRHTYLLLSKSVFIIPYPNREMQEETKTSPPQGEDVMRTKKEVTLAAVVSPHARVTSHDSWYLTSFVILSFVNLPIIRFRHIPKHISSFSRENILCFRMCVGCGRTVWTFFIRDVKNRYFLPR